MYRDDSPRGESSPSPLDVPRSIVVRCAPCRVATGHVSPEQSLVVTDNCQEGGREGKDWEEGGFFSVYREGKGAFTSSMESSIVCVQTYAGGCHLRGGVSSTSNPRLFQYRHFPFLLKPCSCCSFFMFQSSVSAAVVIVVVNVVFVVSAQAITPNNKRCDSFKRIFCSHKKVLTLFRTASKRKHLQADGPFAGPCAEGQEVPLGFESPPPSREPRRRQRGDSFPDGCVPAQKRRRG